MTLENIFKSERRFLVSQHKIIRQKSVADFIASTAQTAIDMRSLIEMQLDGDSSKETQSTIDYLERIIEKAYTEAFGTDLGK